MAEDLLYMMRAVGDGGGQKCEYLNKGADEIDRLRGLLHWLLLHTSGSELRRMVGELSDTSSLNEFIAAIERAKS